MRMLILCILHMLDDTFLLGDTRGRPIFNVNPLYEQSFILENMHVPSEMGQIVSFKGVVFTLIRIPYLLIIFVLKFACDYFISS